MPADRGIIERHGELFIDRVYTPEEIKYCQSRKQSTQHFTGRWAAKEAILKAIGTGWSKGISWRDMEVRNEPGGKPVVAVRGGVKDVIERLGVAEIHVTISHCRTHATATAIVVGREKKDEFEPNVVRTEFRIRPENLENCGGFGNPPHTIKKDNRFEPCPLPLG